MQIRVLFHSYFKDLTGCADARFNVQAGATLATLLEKVRERFPKLEPMRKSTLVAVGVEYQGGDYVLKDADEVSLFPPVQGG